MGSTTVQAPTAAGVAAAAQAAALVGGLPCGVFVSSVVTPPTGVTVLKARFIFLGTWISATLP